MLGYLLAFDGKFFRQIERLIYVYEARSCERTRACSVLNLHCIMLSISRKWKFDMNFYTWLDYLLYRPLRHRNESLI